MTHIATVSRLWKTALAGIYCAAALAQPGLAQVPPASILRIDTANAVLYTEYASDPSKFATEPNITPGSTPSGGTFTRILGVADIQSVNGQPVTGTNTR